MQATLHINRIKIGDKIQEIFTVTPDNYLFFDPKRQINLKLWAIRNKQSMHNLGYKLINIIDDNPKQIIYEFKYDNKLSIPLLNETITYQYIPFMGKKKCTKCDNFINGYCRLKSIKVNHKSYYRCLYWFERWNDVFK